MKIPHGRTHEETTHWGGTDSSSHWPRHRLVCGTLGRLTAFGSSSLPAERKQVPSALATRAHVGKGLWPPGASRLWEAWTAGQGSCLQLVSSTGGRRTLCTFLGDVGGVNRESHFPAKGTHTPASISDQSTEQPLGSRKSEHTLQSWHLHLLPGHLQTQLSSTGLALPECVLNQLSTSSTEGKQFFIADWSQISVWIVNVLWSAICFLFNLFLTALLVARYLCLLFIWDINQEHFPP